MKIYREGGRWMMEQRLMLKLRDMKNLKEGFGALVGWTAVFA